MTGGKKPLSALQHGFAQRPSEDGRDVTWVDAYLPVGKKWKRRIFKAEEIHRIESTNPKIAELCLHDGTSIPVMMDAGALWQKIYAPDFRSAGEPIGLLSVTGAEAFPMPLMPEPGEMVKGEGIYIGEYDPKDGNGKSLGKLFNVYAAPEDLTSEISYKDALKKLKELKSWHGYDGTDYATSKKIIAALMNGNYKGGWIMPPLEIVEVGVQEASLCRHKNSGLLSGTFSNVNYMTSTEKDGSESFHAVKMESGENTSINSGYTGGRACRPVRLVEVKPAY